MTETNNNQRRIAEKRRARRRKAIRNRIIFGSVLVILVAAIIFIGIKIFGSSSTDNNESVNFGSTVSTEGETTTAAQGNGTDTTGPTITGVTDKEVAVGGTISYKQGVTVSDDTDTNPKLDVDASGVDLNTPGTYTVTYTATDASGNATSTTCSVTVKEVAETTAAQGVENDDPATEDEVAYMKYLAKAYLQQMGVTDDMSDYDKAYKIWHWTNWEIDYTATSDKSSWVRGAIQAFDTHKGDCFNYFAAAKALLTEAGIENIDVVKSDTSHSSHFWSLVDVGDGWYHFDTTPRDGGGDYFFLVTDAQIDEYSQAHENSHVFDHSLYPATNEKIITDLDAQPPHEG